LGVSCIYKLIRCPFNAPAPTATYPLSLHDALPIFRGHRARAGHLPGIPRRAIVLGDEAHRVEQRQHEHRPQPHLQRLAQHAVARSEEHTSELQSRENLVCRLLLEKKKIAKVIWSEF